MTRSLASTVTDIAEAGREGRAVFLTAAECRDLAGLIANGRVAEFRLAAHVVRFAPESPADADFGDLSLASQVRDLAQGSPSRPCISLAECIRVNCPDCAHSSHLAPVIPSSLAGRVLVSGCEASMDTAGDPDISGSNARPELATTDQARKSAQTDMYGESGPTSRALLSVASSPYEGRTVDVAALAGVHHVARRPELQASANGGGLCSPIEHRDRDRGEAADEGGMAGDRGAGPSHCTGLSARWCPIHGDCTCEADDWSKDLDSPTCPLHSSASTHAEGATS